MIVGTLRGLEIGVDDLRSVDLVDHEAVGRAVAAAVRAPEIAARTAVDTFEEVMRAHVIGLEIVRVGTHQRRVLVFGNQVKHLLAVAVVRVAQRDVVVEHDHLALGDEGQILFEPRHLLVGEAAGVVLTREEAVVHRDEMHFAAVERVPPRAEHVAIGVARVVDRALVVVADGGEEGDARLAQCTLHRGEGLCVALAQDVSQRDADGRDRVVGLDLLDVGHGLRAETLDVLVVVGLGIAQSEEQEAGVALGEFRQREVGAVGFRAAARQRVRRLVGSLVGAVIRLRGNFITRRGGDEDVLGVGAAHDLVDAFRIGGDDAVTVADDDAFEGIAFAVAHQSVEGDALVGLDLGFLLFRAVLAVIASAGQLGDDRIVSAAGDRRCGQCCEHRAAQQIEDRIHFHCSCILISDQMSAGHLV